MKADTCELLRVDISARLDGELDESRARELDEHLETCAACRDYEARMRSVRRAMRVHSAEPVPDLTAAIMQRVEGQRARVARRREWGSGARIAAVAAAVAALLVLATSVPFTDRQPQSAAAEEEIVRQVRAAAEELTSYRATFSIVERGFTSDVASRRFTAKVLYDAPERFRLTVRDDTIYPDPRWPANNISLIANPSRWWIEQPRTCPLEVLLECDVPQGTSEQTVVKRQPFDGTSTLPTDIIVPLETMASSGDFDVLGRDHIAGRTAVKVLMPFREALPLVTALQPAGLWRGFHAADRVEIWLDEQTWFPLRFQVSADASAERAQWAELNDYRDEPGDALLKVTAQRFSEPSVARDRFEPPADGTIRSGDFRSLQRPGPRWSEPEYTAQLDPYRFGKTPDGRVVMTWAEGMTWLKATGGPTSERSSVLPASAEQVPLRGGGWGYYQPGTETIKRRLDLFSAGGHVHLESNLSRDELIKVASSFEVVGERLDSVIERSGGTTVERLSVERALDFAFVYAPGYLPHGYLPSAALATTSDDEGRSVTTYYRRPEAEYGGDGIRITQSPSIKVLAPSGELADVLALNGVEARWFPERGQLEWIEGHVYRSVTVPTGDLGTALLVARSLR
ncbi:MAG: zf-HC2 domain-containing protein [Actinomycetota bacterium]